MGVEQRGTSAEQIAAAHRLKAQLHAVIGTDTVAGLIKA